MNENGYDVRGKQSSIFRLFCFDKEGLLHMTTYRLNIFAAFILAISLTYGAIEYGNPLTSLSKAMIILVWILFTPQLFETAKAMMIMASRGIVFGRLNKSFVEFGAEKKGIYPLYAAFPYVVLLVWIVGFVIVAGLWL